MIFIRDRVETKKICIIQDSRKKWSGGPHNVIEGRSKGPNEVI